ncbi:hypothetical protein X551_03521 [Methylibium sp. T29]|nr:hypothetical protein X551_03521 [Methylibium sp. T29]EWS61841.1 hypothetical protein Y694_00353 [Methylibium sp. T29-B]
MAEPAFQVRDAWERMADGPFTPYDPWDRLAMEAVKGRWHRVRCWLFGSVEGDIWRLLNGDPLYTAAHIGVGWAWGLDIWRAKWDMRLSYTLSMWISGITKPWRGYTLARLFRSSQGLIQPLSGPPRHR